MACFPFHCGIVRPVTSGFTLPAPANCLFLGGHGRGLSFLAPLRPHSYANWRLTFDDYLPNKEIASFWFGYHESYDLMSDQNAPPASGRVRGYTHARVMRLIDWALANFPVDPNRVYAWGHSMGGSFAIFLSLTAGERLAGAWANVPKLDLSDFRGTGLFPGMFEPMWGSPEADLPTDQGMPVYDRLRILSAFSEIRGVALGFLQGVVSSGVIPHSDPDGKSLV